MAKDPDDREDDIAPDPMEAMNPELEDSVVESDAQAETLDSSELSAPGQTPASLHSAGVTAPIRDSEHSVEGALPQQLGRYKIEKLIGSGGFGQVLLGFDDQLRRPVAIKIAGRQRSRRGTEEFLEEARRLARLRHPSIVTVHDVGVDDGRCYIVTDFLDGPSGDKWLATHRPSWQEAGAIVAALADAIAHAHAQSTIHRDIKLQNVIMIDGAHPVLVDFGLALTEEDDLERYRGSFAGTPAYMSPEQTYGRAHTIDGRTDIYSLGVMLYTLLCFRKPFRGKTSSVLLQQIREDKPQPPRQLRPEIPATLELACLRAMAKDPDDRFTTAGDFAAAIQSSLEPDAASPIGMKETVDSFDLNLNPRSSKPPAPSKGKRHVERRQVTMLHFTWELLDAEGEGVAEIDPEQEHEIASAFRERRAAVIERFDATELPSAGDEMLACFGFPIGYEDSAHRAVRCGLEMLEAVKLLNVELSKQKLSLSPTLAAHTGVVVVGDDDGPDTISLVGDARNLVTRLTQMIEPQLFLVTAATHRLVRGYFNFEQGETVKVRGSRTPVELHEVHGENAAQSRIDAADDADLTPLVGRAREMELLEERWEEAQEGMGQLVVLVGDAGLGKSRLVHTVRKHVLEEHGLTGPGWPQRDVAPRGNPVIDWRCASNQQTSGLYPATDFFQRLLQFGRGDSAADKLDRLENYFSQFNIGSVDEVVPLIASMMSVSYEDRYGPLQLTPARQKERTLETLFDWLRDCASQQPVLFIVEDLHWIDASTQEFLSLVVQQGEQDPLMCLMTYRPEYTPPWSTVPHQTQVGLTRLRRKQIVEMMTLKTGVKELPPHVVDQIIERTDGIPLFVEEFTQMVWESGGLVEVDGEVSVTDSFSLTGIPTTLHDLIIARLDRMESNREVAQLAATLGRDFSWEYMAGVYGSDEQALKAELDKLVDADLLIQRGRPPKCSYQFKHALIQDAAYDSLLKKARQEFHARIGKALEEQFPETMEANPELLAHHFTGAGDAPKAVHYWLQAGLRGQSRNALAESIASFSRGLQLIAAMDESVERDQIELQFQLPMGNALIQARGYAAPEVAAAFQRAHELCQRIGADAPLFHVSVGMWKFTLVNGDFDKCRYWADKLRTLAASQSDPGIQMEACFPTCCTLFYVGSFAESIEYGEQGFALYDAERCQFHAQFTGQNAGVGIPAYGSLAMWAHGYPDRAIRWSREGVTLARGLQDPFSLAFGLYHLGWLEYWCGNWKEVQQCGDQGRAIAEELNFAFFEALAIINQGAAKICNREASADVHRDGIRIVREGLAAYMGTGAALHISHPYVARHLPVAHLNLKQILDLALPLQPFAILLP